jgi:hypothetical protein
MVDAAEYRCGWSGCGAVFKPTVKWQRYCCREHRYRVHYEQDAAGAAAALGRKPRLIPIGPGGPRPAVRRLVRRYEQTKTIDARTLEGRTEKSAIRDLIEHVGGCPSVPQKILIVRAARLLVLTEAMEERMMHGGEIGDWAGRQTLAWINTLRRTLEALGLERAQQQPAKLADVLRVKAA